MYTYTTEIPAMFCSCSLRSVFGCAGSAPNVTKLVHDFCAQIMVISYRARIFVHTHDQSVGKKCRYPNGVVGKKKVDACIDSSACVCVCLYVRFVHKYLSTIFASIDMGTTLASVHSHIGPGDRTLSLSLLRQTANTKIHLGVRMTPSTHRRQQHRTLRLRIHKLAVQSIVHRTVKHTNALLVGLFETTMHGQIVRTRSRNSHRVAAVKRRRGCANNDTQHTYETWSDRTDTHDTHGARPNTTRRQNKRHEYTTARPGGKGESESAQRSVSGPCRWESWRTTRNVLVGVSQ